MEPASRSSEGASVVAADVADTATEHGVIGLIKSAALDYSASQRHLPRHHRHAFTLGHAMVVDGGQTA